MVMQEKPMEKLFQSKNNCEGLITKPKGKQIHYIKLKFTNRTSIF